jgi:hypothetical protein
VLFLKERTPNTINQGRQGPNYKISGPIHNDIEMWKDRHAKTKLLRASLTKLPTLRRGSRIQRSPMRASTVDRAVLPVHGSTVDRPFKTKGYAIRAIRARSDGPGRSRAGCGGEHAGVRRRAAGACRRCAWAAFPATNTTTG